MRRPTLAPLIAIVPAVVLLFGGYVGAYYAMLERGLINDEVTDDPRPWGELVPLYRIQGAPTEYALWPAHQIDRLIRPNYWQLGPVDSSVEISPQP
jgi:hypothetical protein